MTSISRSGVSLFPFGKPLSLPDRLQTVKMILDHRDMMFWFYANHYWKFKQKNIAHRECIFGNHLLTCIRSMLALVISSDHKSYRSTNTARKKGTQSWLRLCGPQCYDKNVEIYLVKVNKTYLHVNQIFTSATRIAWLSAESVFVFVLFRFVFVKKG